MLQTPVLLLVFNRLDTAQQVFARIREARPCRLFIGSDGARAGKEGEAEKVQAVREYLLANIDWDCEVKTLFREQNLGCGIAPYQAITWFFEHVEQGIILEDDCLPDASFFSFCDELLERYKDNERVMHIAGSNFQMGHKRGDYSYFFSLYAPGWGWATWRRAWKYYDFYLASVTPQRLEQVLQNNKFSLREIAYWQKHFEEVRNGKRPDIWDLQWAFTIWLFEGIAISPQVNLISNVGFGENATHTTQKDSTVANLRTESLANISHPPHIAINQAADRFTFATHVEPPTDWYQYIRHSLLPRLVPNFVKKFLRKKTTS